MNKIIKLSTLGLMILFLSINCGGGGSSSSNNSDDPFQNPDDGNNQPTNQSAVVIGQANLTDGNNQALRALRNLEADQLTLSAIDTADNIIQGVVANNGSFRITLETNTDYIISFKHQGRFLATLIYTTNDGRNANSVRFSSGEKNLGIIYFDNGVARSQNHPLSINDSDNDGTFDIEDADFSLSNEGSYADDYVLVCHDIIIKPGEPIRENFQSQPADSVGRPSSNNQPDGANNVNLAPISELTNSSDNTVGSSGSNDVVVIPEEFNDIENAGDLDYQNDCYYEYASDNVNPATNEDILFEDRIDEENFLSENALNFLQTLFETLFEREDYENILPPLALDELDGRIDGIISVDANIGEVRSPNAQAELIEVSENIQNYCINTINGQLYLGCEKYLYSCARECSVSHCESDVYEDENRLSLGCFTETFTCLNECVNEF